MWVRGLKQTFATKPFQVRLVAPRVGAWIETKTIKAARFGLLSHPVWVRGLKHAQDGTRLYLHQVAPRVGAWIETANCLTSSMCCIVAPRVGAWIETICGRTQNV